MDLTGVVLQALDANGHPSGPLWSTTLSQRVRPLGYTASYSPGGNPWPLLNAESGALDVLAPAGVIVPTVLWQYRPQDLPPQLLLNIFFNGATSPGISAIVPLERGFAHFQPNTQPWTPSLAGQDVENHSGLFFDDGQLRAELVAAFAFSTGHDPQIWRLIDYKTIDRVGLSALAPDGQPDGVLIFELDVNTLSQGGGSSARAAPPAGVARGAIGGWVAGPATPEATEGPFAVTPAFAQPTPGVPAIGTSTEGIPESTPDLSAEATAKAEGTPTEGMPAIGTPTAGTPAPTPDMSAEASAKAEAAAKAETKTPVPQTETPVMPAEQTPKPETRESSSENESTTGFSLGSKNGPMQAASLAPFRG